ncbi:MAG: alpha/beta hydrolase [Marinilabiliales bacterium]|nr:alpha/beta hydrolase [Marinilabiliales bacterium]
MLVSGLGEASTYWGGWVAPAVARNTTVCAYDRAGQGWSGPPPSPQGGVAVVTDLHILLDLARIPGPYVLVGHRQAAPTQGIFAARHPDQIPPASSCSTRSQTKPSPDCRTSPPSIESSARRQRSSHL